MVLRRSDTLCETEIWVENKKEASKGNGRKVYIDVMQKCRRTEEMQSKESLADRSFLSPS